MKSTQTNLAWLLAVCLMAACIGEVDEGGSEEEEPTEEEPVEEVPAPVSTTVSGMVSDYFFLATGNTPQPILAPATVATLGLDPALNAISAEGLYSFEAVPVTARLNFNLTVPNYRPTVSEELVIGDQPIADHMLWAVSNTYMAGNYNNILETADPLLGEVVAHLHRNNGEPFDGLAVDAITLVDPLAPDVPVIAPTYLFGADGYIDPLTLATDSLVDPSGMARVALVNVPPGTYELTITYLNGQLVEQTQVTPVTVSADSISLVSTGGGGGGGGGTPDISNREPPPDGLYGFVEDIYPLLQATTANPAGDGCANCHSALGDLGAAAAIQFNLPAADVLAALLAPRIVDDVAADPLVVVNDALNSLFLLNPSLLLVEPLILAEHPTKIWSDSPNDYFFPSYTAVETWINQGAPLTRADNLAEPVIPADGGGGGGGGGGGQ